MNLKLEITGVEILTPKQKGLIAEKLEEIKVIVKETTPSCKDENLCEKVKFNQQVEDIISSNREKSFQQCEALFSESPQKELSDNQKTSQNYALIILPVKP